MINNRLYYFNNLTGYFFDSSEVTVNEVEHNDDMIELGFDDMAIDYAENWANIDMGLNEDDWNIEIDMNVNDYTLYINKQPTITGDLIDVLDILTSFVFEWKLYHDRYRMKKGYFCIG